jgi:hypothetical protein
VANAIIDFVMLLAALALLAAAVAPATVEKGTTSFSGQ